MFVLFNAFSETQGQIVGARESLNGQKNFSPFFTFLRSFSSFRLSLAPTICPWVSEDVFKEQETKTKNFPHSMMCRN